MSVFFLIILILHILFYGACCFLIMRRKTFTSISIRSPFLLICNNLCCFFMSLIIIINKLHNEEENNISIKYISGFYYIFQFLMILSFCLRTQRIINCCIINPTEKIMANQKYVNTNLLQEKYFFRLMLIFLCFFVIILFLIDIIIQFPLTFSFIDNNYSKRGVQNVLVWMVINFMEQLALITYLYNICVNKLKQKLRLELFAFIIIFFIHTNLVSIADFRRLITGTTKSNNFIIGITLLVNFLYLMINGFLPIALTYSYHFSTSYYYTPQLINNLFLFLSNEICYKEFKNYFNKAQNSKGCLYLELYSDIMNYKLGFTLKVSTEEGYQEAEEIYNTYFKPDTYENIIEKNVIEKIRQLSPQLEKNVYKTEFFDDALKFVYDELNKLFLEFKKTDKFKEILNELYLNSSIQCKMCFNGLVNKF